MFKITVIMPISAKMETVLRLLGTYKITLKRKNHWNTIVQFYYIRANFLVLRGPEVFLSWYLVKCTLCNPSYLAMPTSTMVRFAPMSKAVFTRTCSPVKTLVS